MNNFIGVWMKRNNCKVGGNSRQHSNLKGFIGLEWIAIAIIGGIIISLIVVPGLGASLLSVTQNVPQNCDATPYAPNCVCSLGEVMQTGFTRICAAPG